MLDKSAPPIAKGRYAGAGTGWLKSHIFFTNKRAFLRKSASYFFRCRARPPSSIGKTACAALRFGAVDEISFPYRHH
jgi:hypothetical protein